MMNTHRFVVISMLATGGLHSAFATDASATDAAADRPFWVLQGGLQIDDKDSYMVNGGLSYMPNAQTYAALDFGFSDSSAGMEDFETNFASLRLDHSFGPLGGSISMGWFGEADIVDRFSYSGSIYLELHRLMAASLCGLTATRMPPLFVSRMTAAACLPILFAIACFVLLTVPRAVKEWALAPTRRGLSSLIPAAAWRLNPNRGAALW